MSRSAKIYMHDRYVGIFRQDDEGYSFNYDIDYLNTKHPIPVSLTLPLKKEAYKSTTIIPFFDGLIPEGWHLEGVELNPHDRMGLLLSLCTECIGAVRVEPMEEVNYEQ